MADLNTPDYQNLPSPELGNTAQQPYYYQQPQQPYEQTTTTETTTEVPASSGGSIFKSKKLIIIVLVIVGVVLLLILLLSLLNRNATPGGTDTTQNVSLQFRGAFIPEAAMQPLIDEYETANPNIKVEYADKWADNTAYEDAEQIYKTDLNQVLRENDSVNIPDIFMVNNSWEGDYEKYTKTSSSIDYSTFKSVFYPAAAQDFASDQQVHGVPLWLDTLAILYNKDILSSKSIQTPSTDWVEFKKQAQTLTSKEGSTIKVGGFAAGNLSNVSYGFELANILLLQNGVQMTNTQNQPIFSTFNEAVPALQYFQSFQSDSNNTWNATMENDSAAFLESKVAMIASTSYRYRDILKYNKAFNINLNIGVSQIPQISGQSEPIINFADYWGAMVSNARGNSTYAWDFLKWLEQPEQLRLLSDNIAKETDSFGILYPRTDMAQILETDKDLSVFNASLPYAQSWYMANGTSVRAAFKGVINNGGVNQSTVTTLQSAIQTIITNKGQI